MSLPEPNPLTHAIHRMLGWLALSCLVVLLIFLTSCTECPDQRCPVFPTSAPRQ